MKRENSKGQTMTEALDESFMNEESSDFKIICQNQTFPCHKFILALRSEVFAAMFRNMDCTEAQNNQMIMEDAEPKDVKHFLKFLYKDKIKPKHICGGVLLLADKYGVFRLFNICIKHFSASISLDNIFEVMLLGHMVNNDKLVRRTAEFVQCHAGILKKSKDWKVIKQRCPGLAMTILERIMFKKAKVERKAIVKLDRFDSDLVAKYLKTNI